MTVRDLEYSPIRETEDYAKLLVFIELYGVVSKDMWWVGTSSIALYDQFTLLLRKLKLNYRAQKAKVGKRTQFTICFQVLPDTLPTYRPVFSNPAKELIRFWQEQTSPTQKTKIIALTKGQKGTLEWCLHKVNNTFRLIERSIEWKGRIADGYFFDISKDVPAVWKEDREKARVGEILHILTD